MICNNIKQKIRDISKSSKVVYMGAEIKTNMAEFQKDPS